MARVSIICCLLAMTLMLSQTYAQSGTKPKYAADVPESIMTPNTVETERLGTMKFFDGMREEATVQKVYDNLDFQDGWGSTP